MIREDLKGAFDIPAVMAAVPIRAMAKGSMPVKKPVKLPSPKPKNAPIKIEGAKIPPNIPLAKVMASAIALMMESSKAV
jgi:hypothetical protein